MARQIGPTVETLMRRVRQEGGLAVDPDFATRIYSYCEQVTNAHTQRIVASDTLTTPKQKLLYHYRTEFPDAIDIVGIRESGRRIERCDNLMQLSAYDITWFRSITGTRFEAWHQLGRDILILYPGQAAASTVTVDYVSLLTSHTNFTTSYSTDSALPAEDVEFALKLAELTLLARNRQIADITTRIQSFLSTYSQSVVTK